MSEFKVYVGRKSCGCITAAFVPLIELKQTAKIVATWIEAGLVIDRIPFNNLPFEFHECHCYDRKDNAKKEEDLPLFDSAGVQVDGKGNGETPKAEEPKVEAVAPAEPTGPVLGLPAEGLPDDAEETVNAAGEKVIVVKSTGEIFPMSVADAIRAEAGQARDVTGEQSPEEGPSLPAPDWMEDDGKAGSPDEGPDD